MGIFDIHCNTGTDPDCLGYAYGVLNSSAFAAWAAVILETNLATHDVGRALIEAKATNMLFTDGVGRLFGRAASFCLERSGYNEGGLNDQGLLFYLPNATWLQPPGHVHRLTAQTRQPLAVEVVAQGPGCPDDRPGSGMLSAQASEDGRTVVVRVVNPGPPRNISVQVNFSGLAAVQSVAATSIGGALHATNTPSRP